MEKKLVLIMIILAMLQPLSALEFNISLKTGATYWLDNQALFYSKDNCGDFGLSRYLLFNQLSFRYYIDSTISCGIQVGYINTVSNIKKHVIFSEDYSKDVGSSASAWDFGANFGLSNIFFKNLYLGVEHNFYLVDVCSVLPLSKDTKNIRRIWWGAAANIVYEVDFPFWQLKISPFLRGEMMNTNRELLNEYSFFCSLGMMIRL